MKGKGKQKCISKTFPVDIYKHGVKVFFGECGDLVNELKKDGVVTGGGKEEEIMERSESSEMMAIALTTGDVVIWGPAKPKTNGEMVTLIHEIFHATSYLLRNVGIEHSDETEEAYAYTMEYLSDRILTWVFG